MSRVGPGEAGADADDCAAVARDTAEYIASMAAELKRLAMASDLDFLAYLIDMVVVEAIRAARGEDDGRSSLD